MANLPPNNNDFAPAAEAAPDNMNGWVEEEDPEMEEEEEDPEEDPEMEEEEEKEEMEADEQWDGPEWILPYQGADPLYPSPPASDSEAEAEDEAEAGPRLKLHPYHLLFLLILYLSHNPEDLTSSHIRSDLDALHRRVQHIEEEEDVRADNK
ncbi:hypothetical protein Tco_0284612 [Tanacetum coccineum]